MILICVYSSGREKRTAGRNEAKDDLGFYGSYAKKVAPKESSPPKRIASTPVMALSDGEILHPATAESWPNTKKSSTLPAIAALPDAARSRNLGGTSSRPHFLSGLAVFCCPVRDEVTIYKTFPSR